MEFSHALRPKHKTTFYRSNAILKTSLRLKEAIEGVIGISPQWCFYWKVIVDSPESDSRCWRCFDNKNSRQNQIISTIITTNMLSSRESQTTFTRRFEQHIIEALTMGSFGVLGNKFQFLSQWNYYAFTRSYSRKLFKKSSESFNMFTVFEKLKA